MPIKLTNARINYIKTRASEYINGKQSYTEAFAAAKREGLFGYLRYHNNNQKHSVIEKQFLTVLQEMQVELAIAGIDKLQKIENKISGKDIHTTDAHILYQKALCNINFENSNLKLSIEDMKLNGDKNIEIHLINYDKATKKSTFNTQTILVNDEQTKNRILAEYQIFNHKQFGRKINHEAYQNTPKASELMDEYKKSQIKYQYDAICFSGGGAKGIGYPGVLDSLGKYRLQHVKSVSGASAGAITAALVSAGIKPYELTEFVGTKNLKVGQAQLRYLIRDKLLKTIVDRLSEYKDVLTPEQTDLITAFNHSLVAKKDVTFRELDKLMTHFPELGFKKLFINAHLVNSNPPQEVELSSNTCPDMPISLAAIASAALPVLFRPVDATQYFTQEVKKKLALNMDVISLDDGGIVSNIPYSYLKSSNPLIISFEENKSLYSKGLLTFEKIKNYLAKAPAYIYRRADIYELEMKIGEPFYLNTQEIKTTSFKQAARQVITLNQAIKEDFIKYDIEKPQHNLSTRDTHILKILKFTIYPMYYDGNLYQQRILNTLYKDKKTFFEYLQEEIDLGKFKKCYMQFEKAVSNSLKDSELRETHFLMRTP